MSIHMGPRQWGWNARAASPLFLAVEFAQPTYERISDAQVRAFCWWWRQEVEATWGAYTVGPTSFPTHAEVEHWGLTGAVDGKTDMAPYGSPAADDLRARIAARLADQGWA